VLGKHGMRDSVSIADTLKVHDLSATSLANLINALNGKLDRISESLLLAEMLRFPVECWRSHKVHSSLSFTGDARCDLRTILVLMQASQPLDPKQIEFLKRFYADRESSRSYFFSDLIFTLHHRRVLDAGEVLAPLIRFNCRPRKLVALLLPVSVCAPERVNLRHLAILSRLGFLRVRLLSTICRFYHDSSREAARVEISKQLKVLARRRKAMRRKILKDIYWHLNRKPSNQLLSMVLEAAETNRYLAEAFEIIPLLARSKTAADVVLLERFSKNADSSVASLAMVSRASIE